MGIELIHAAPDLTELRQITEFTQFDAAVSADPDGQNDWMLELPAQCWQNEPVYEGHYVYISGSEWGGLAERVRHSSTDDTVRVYGTCWRGLLTRRAICPAEGDTHAVYESMDANEIIRQMLSGWLPSLIKLSDDSSAVVCSGSIRYRNMLESITDMLSDAGGNLRVSFSDGEMKVWAEPVRDLSNEIELSQDYDCTIISERNAARYDHIIALGQGEMLERTVVELWMLPDGTATEDKSEMGTVEDELCRTYIYDYPVAESREALADSAARKLYSLAGGDIAEVSMITEHSELQLGDRVSVRDMMTDILNVLTVIGMNVNITADAVEIRHTLR